MTTPEPIYRYRAVKPFEEEQSMLFFGRKAETEQLAALIFSEKLTVLYGKSGYGKSSLLNAGILPRLKSENEKGQKRFVPVPIRFQNSEAGGESLMEKFRFHFSQAVKKQGIAAAAPPENIALPETLWGLFKTLQPTFGSPSGAGGTVFVLLFDQFEEFFSYPAAQQDEFKTQLSELLYTAYPNFVRENRKNLSDAELDFLSRDLDLRAVFAIRSDRLSDLDRLSRPLAAILKNRMELGALSESQAEEAILRPAALPNDGGIFKTEKFSFSDEALRRIKSALVGKDSKRIESFVLQIVCFSIEKTAERLRLAEIGTENLPDFNELFDNYYREQLAELPETDRAAAAHLLEFQLLGYNPQTGTAHRRSVDSADLAAPPVLLEALERSYLIRREVNSFGRFSYEISHDTLVEPVLKARKIKDAAEADRKKRAELAAETERIAREKAEAGRRGRRALVTAVVAGVLILGAVGASVFAFQKIKEARLAKEEANTATKIADDAVRLATQKTRQASLDSLWAELKTVEGDSLADLAEIKKLAAENAEYKAKILLEASRYLAKKNLPKNFEVFIFNDSLNFEGWKLKFLPEEIAKLKNLQSLDVSNNLNIGLPDNIAGLQNLKSLNLSRNSYHINFPDVVFKLQKLQSLYLSQNGLEEIPSEIAKLQDLRLFDFNNNHLDSLPSIILKLQNLQELNLTRCELTKLSAKIGNLQKLQTLKLGFNNIDTLPVEIGNLKKLQSLNLSVNNLTNLCAEIGNLESLKSLKLDNNKLEKIPAEIGKLKKLQLLSLSDNNLKEICSEIGNLQKLQFLDLSNNPLDSLQLDSMFIVIAKLPRLQSLNLRGIKLKRLSTEFVKLPNLQSLDLTAWTMRSLTIEELKRMSNLKKLVLYDDSDDPDIEEEVIDALRHAMPWCEIVWEFE